MRLAASVSFVVALLVVASGAGWAESITNWSFENPDIGDGSGGDGPPYDWKYVTPTGWTWNNVGGRAVILEGDFVGNPTTTHGDQWGFLNHHAALSQLVGSGTLKANETYSFSFYQFEQLGMDHGSGVQIEIWDGNPFTTAGSLLDSASFASTGTGNMVKRTGSLDTGASATSGGDLYLVLRAFQDPYGNWRHVGNVHLDEIVFGSPSPVPEPGTLALFGLGIGGIVMRRRKRRLA